MASAFASVEDVCKDALLHDPKPYKGWEEGRRPQVEDLEGRQ